MLRLKSGRMGARGKVAVAGTCAVLFATSGLMAGPGKRGNGPARTPPKPQAEGITIHHCSCAVGCPCMFGPQLTTCRMVIVNHIDRGSAHGKKLDGATVVVVYPSIADLAAKPAPRFKAAVYVDNRFPRETQELLVRIFTTSNVRKDKKLLATPAEIKFNRTGKGFRTEVKGFVTAQTTARTGRDGKQIVVHNVNFAEGDVWRVGENLEMTLNEPMAGWKWDMKGRNGTWTEWAWTGGNTPVPAVDPRNPPRGADAQKNRITACTCCGK